MTTETKKQIDRILKKQKKLAMTFHNPVERAEIYGAWSGFLAGMRLTGAISRKEYQSYYNEMVDSENRRILAG